MSGGKKKRKAKANITACTKCATACRKSKQHKLDQLFSSCFEHTVQSVDSEPMHHCCCCFFFFYAILMCRAGSYAADLPGCHASSVSQLCPIRNTKYMFRRHRGCRYRCLCVQPRRRRLEAGCHHITKTMPNRLTVLLIRGNMTPLVLQSQGLL